MDTCEHALRKAEARIRQLCCLGLRSEVAVPAMLRELHHVIPSYANTFYWIGADGECTNIYDEQPGATRILPEYLERFCNKAETEVHPGFTRMMRKARGVHDNTTFFSVSDARLRHSAFYACIMRPQHYHHILQLYVRTAGRTRAVLQLQRSDGERAFGAGDKLALARLHGFIAHALARDSAASIVTDAWLPGGTSGMLLADGHGRVTAASPRARQLLFLATHPTMPHDVQVEPRLPRALIAICRNLRQVERQSPAAQAPLHTCSNAWGRFIFSAYRLDGARGDDGMVGIHVRREVPLMVRLVSATRHFPLSRRQAQIASLLAGGLSHRAIAERLDLKRNTVISHSRHIYDKLDVHDGRSLRQALLAAADGDPSPAGSPPATPPY